MIRPLRFFPVPEVTNAFSDRLNVYALSSVSPPPHYFKRPQYHSGLVLQGLLSFVTGLLKVS